MEKLIRDKFLSVFYNQEVRPWRASANTTSEMFTAEDVLAAAKKIKCNKARGNDYWSVK